ncbi:MAG: YhcH/YjgK/YiaL family protein [Vicinamibacterales bacterium]
MIHDHIKYASGYFNLSRGIRAALEYLQQADLDTLTPGRHDVNGDAVFALVSDYETRSPEETFWEAHRRHVDVQSPCIVDASASRSAISRSSSATPTMSSAISSSHAGTADSQSMWALDRS